MEDLSLRAFRDEDLGFLDRLCADPAALGEFEWFGFRDVRTWRRRWEQDGFIGPDSTVLAVVLADGTLVGTTSWKVVNRGGSPGACFEIGLALLPEYRGQGLGTRGQRHPLPPSPTREGRWPARGYRDCYSARAGHHGSRPGRGLQAARPAPADPARLTGWEREVRRAAYCANPVRLAGRIEQADKRTGEVREAYTTEHEPDGVLLKACGNRRASVCPGCAEIYRRDAWHLIAALRVLVRRILDLRRLVGIGSDLGICLPQLSAADPRWLIVRGPSAARGRTRGGRAFGLA